MAKVASYLGFRIIETLDASLVGTGTEYIFGFTLDELIDITFKQNWSKFDISSDLTASGSLPIGEGGEPVDSLTASYGTNSGLVNVGNSGGEFGYVSYPSPSMIPTPEANLICLESVSPTYMPTSFESASSPFNATSPNGRITSSAGFQVPVTFNLFTSPRTENNNSIVYKIGSLYYPSFGKFSIYAGMSFQGGSYTTFVGAFNFQGSFPEPGNNPIAITIKTSTYAVGSCVVPGNITLPPYGEPSYGATMSVSNFTIDNSAYGEWPYL